MSSPLGLRPVFELPLGISREEAIVCLGRHQQTLASDRLVLLHGEYGELHLPDREHRLWSPHLSFYIHEVDGRPVLFGRFAPRPDVWTVVWIFYLLFGFSAFFGATIGCAQWAMGLRSWGFWLSISALMGLAGLYLTALIGQQWSADQMLALRSRLEKLLSAAGIPFGSEGRH